MPSGEFFYVQTTQRLNYLATMTGGMFGKIKVIQVNTVSTLKHGSGSIML